MIQAVFASLRAHRRGIVTTLVTILLLERVRRGCRRIERAAREAGEDEARTRSRRDAFLFRAALLYAAPFVLPVVKYLYRSAAELGRWVDFGAGASSPWVFAGVVAAAWGFLAVVAFNLLGIYVELPRRMAREVRRAGRRAAEPVAQAARRVGAPVLDAGQRAVGPVVRAGRWFGRSGAVVARCARRPVAVAKDAVTTFDARRACAVAARRVQRGGSRCIETLDAGWRSLRSRSRWAVRAPGR